MECNNLLKYSLSSFNQSVPMTSIRKNYSQICYEFGFTTHGKSKYRISRYERTRENVLSV